MLVHTFRHLKGIGPARESTWWRQGILTWSDFLGSPEARPHHSLAVRESVSRLENRDARDFADHLPPAERWRLYPDFFQDAVFLDIETTGMSPAGSHVTVVGLLDARGYRAFVRGDNMDYLREALACCKLIVTYNGGSFDLPFLAAEFGPELVSGCAP